MELLKELVNSSPAIAAVIFLVIVFLRAMHKRDEMFERITIRQSDAMDRLSTASNRLSDAIDDLLNRHRK